jgi:imidazolonepropionase-like amidohydrolase
MAAFLTVVFSPAAFASPEIPGADQTRPVAVVGATIHTVSGGVIEGGTLVFDAGRIVAIAKKAALPPGTQRIDGAGRHVYPGLFNACSNLGLVEISAVRATRDYAETGTINPNVKAEVAVNPDSELIPVTRAGGVLLSVAAPSGGLVAGTSAVLMLDGWTWEEMTLKAPAGMHVRWPRMDPVTKSEPTESKEEAGKEAKDPLARLEQTFADARAYQKARGAGRSGAEEHPLDSRLEAMLPVLEGHLPLIVEADEVQQIQAAVAFADRHEVKLVLLGGYGADQCAALLKKHEIPVIVSNVYRLPRRREDDYDAPYTLPARLRAAGIKFCIAADGATDVRNLPHHAAVAAGFGLPVEEAIRAITLYPAEILGLSDRVGSLEVGKDATLIVTDGDLLETATQVESAFVQGRAVDLDNRHKRLWRKYQEKYRRLR